LPTIYSNTILKQYYTQIQIDTMDYSIKTIEAKMGNKALLLRGLPATGFTKHNLDWNLQYFCHLINERLRTDHLYACQWYSDNIDKFIRCNQKTILDNRQISFKDNSDIHPAGVPCIPWYILVASSASLPSTPLMSNSFNNTPTALMMALLKHCLLPYYPDREL